MSAEIDITHRAGGFSLRAAFAIADGGVTALFGPSGAGKSTIVAALAGLIRPGHGRIVIGGTVVFDSAARVFVPPHLRRAGVVFQEPRLFPHLSVEENLRYGARRRAAPPEPAEIARIVDLLGLGALRGRRPAGLSGGEKSRVALARALLCGPKLLLLDEPLAALDAARRHEILPYLEALKSQTGIGMLYVSHALDEVARLADRVVLLREGTVLAEGSVFDLLGDVHFAEGLGQPVFGAVIEARIVAHRDDGLSELRFAGGTLLIGHLPRPLGTILRLRIRAEDVMLAREPPRAISANNILSATVMAVSEQSGTADVQMDSGGSKLVARITSASAHRLGLRPGIAVFAIIKAVTVDPGAGGAITR